MRNFFCISFFHQNGESGGLDYTPHLIVAPLRKRQNPFFSAYGSLPGGQIGKLQIFPPAHKTPYTETARVGSLPAKMHPRHRDLFS
jgi:hypothetical protein